jgi:hypothetical protein
VTATIPSRRYIFTPALRTELRVAYSLPRPRKIAAIEALVQKTQYPRHIFKREASRMALCGESRRPWTAQEDRILHGALGELSIRKIAHKLGRTYESVKARAERLELSGRIRAGYCISDLTQILGVPRYRIHEWIDARLLQVAETEGGIRASDAAVMAFIRTHYANLDLRLADQTWLKGALFGA